jgi:hypothetical protein
VANAGIKTYGYVHVSFNLYDSQGNQVGSTFANVNNLEPGKSWNFEAPVLQRNATDFKLIGVSAFRSKPQKGGSLQPARDRPAILHRDAGSSSWSSTSCSTARERITSRASLSAASITCDTSGLSYRPDGQATIYNRRLVRRRFSSTALTKNTSTATYSPLCFQMCAMRPFGDTDKKSGCGNESDAKTHRTPQHFVRNPRDTPNWFRESFRSAYAPSRRFCTVTILRGYLSVAGFSLCHNAPLKSNGMISPRRIRGC